MDLYFKRHDGQAVTCDDFLAAMSDANGGVDLSGIARWYGQAGTPQLTVSTRYDAAKRTFEVKASQRTPPTPGQPEKVPVMIPIKVGLLGPDGRDLPLRLQGSDEELGTTTVLRCDKETCTYVFTGVPSEPVPSLLRDFSAPVKVTVEGQTDDQLVFLFANDSDPFNRWGGGGQTDDQLVFLFANDSDPFNRWDAGQRLALKLMLSLYAAASKANADGASEAAVASACGAAGGVSEALVGAFRSVLTASDLDGSFKAMAVTLPSMAEFVDAIPEADPVLAYQVRHYVNKQLAARLRPELESLVSANDSPPGEPFVFDAASAARRAVKNKALGMLSALGDAGIEAQLLQRFRGATNMTDRINALACLAESPGPSRDAALAEYYAANRDRPLNMLKWIAVQAGSGAPGNLSAVRSLLQHPAFAITNPNSCYSLFLGFARAAPNFHSKDGSGYEFLADAVLQVRRVVSAFTTYRQYDAPRQALMRAQLQRIAGAEGLSENVYEIVSKSLEQ
ncbi:peptidase M1 family [Raphidocelis subcapitata]|uniref:Peptidase M1 family n=1 Tax=Raphidocelis subcapitata TaxID=307507 RepID=A0A2V0PKT7_9CHLO|nr:peptidase M1 family [Raphidocelis subcapitata]|eukprot:GBF99642.1 peptidase M1 family [Raphidocelis subcapitata]